MKIFLVLLLLCCWSSPAFIIAQETIPTNGLRAVRELSQQSEPPAHPSPPALTPVHVPVVPAPVQSPANEGLSDSAFRTPQPADFVPVLQPGDLQSAASLRPTAGERSFIQQTAYQEPVEASDELSAAEASAISAPATEKTDPASEKTDRRAWLEKAIANEIESLKANTQLDEATKSAKLTALNSATEWVQKSKSYQIRREKFQAEIDGFPVALQSAKDQLKTFETADPLPTPSADSATDELQRELQRVLSEVEIKKTELDNLRAAQSRYSQRITDAPKQKSDAEKRLKKLQDRMTEASPTANDSHDETKYLQIAIRIGSTAEVDMLNLESRHLELSAQLSPLKFDIANNQLKQLELQAKELKRTAENARQREVELQIQRARDAALAANPQLTELANRNEELAIQRNEVAKQILDISAEATKVEEQTKKIESDLASLQKKVDEGINSANSLLLAESHRQLVSPLESRVRLSQLRRDTIVVNQLVSQLQDEREALGDPHAVIVSQLGVPLEDMEEPMKATALKFVETKRSLLDDLLNDCRSYRRSLVETTVQREKFVAGIHTTRELLSKHMLWVRSADPVSLATVRKSSEGLRDITHPIRWSMLTERLWSRGQQSPYEYLMFTIGCAFLYGVVRKLKG